MFRVLAVAVILLSDGALADTGQSPHQMIQQTADELLVVIEDRRAQLESNPQALHRVVDEVLRPNFDVEYASRLVLGRFWPRSTPEQREAFTEALYDSLVRRYSRGLLEYQEDTVEVLPHGGLIGLNEDFVTVKTVVMTRDGIAVPVDYRTRWIDGRWKVFDVKIEGLSYVTYYRDLIGDDVRRKGLDAVIEDLGSS
jgi:phospholipid transport system substrate-binding protein